MNIIRVGQGQTTSSKDTRWYIWNWSRDEREDAIQFALKTSKKIFISHSGCVYQEVTVDQLRKMDLKPKIIKET